MEIYESLIVMAIMFLCFFGFLRAYDWHITQGIKNLAADLKGKRITPEKKVGLYKMTCFMESMGSLHPKHWRAFESEMFHRRSVYSHKIQYKHLYFFMDNVDKKPSVMRQLPV